MNNLVQDFFVDASGAVRCVDERADKSGELLGAQLPGGAEHIMDLLLVAITKNGGEVDDATLFRMTEAVFASPVAQRLNLLPGVHIDDKHGHLEEDACESRNAGCGYDKVRVQVLERMGVATQYQPGDRIQMARDTGWNVQVLTGDHLPNATAAINSETGTTLQTQALHQPDQTPSFNYDIWVVRELSPVMANVLHQHDFAGASKDLGENAEVWGKQLYVETLDILSGGALGEDLIEIG